MGWWQVRTTTYDYDGHAPCEVLHAWADGFGIWHVTLETEGVRATIPPAPEARDAIVTELADREPPSFDPSSIGVRLEEVMPTDRGIQWVYVEVPA